VILPGVNAKRLIRLRSTSCKTAHCGGHRETELDPNGTTLVAKLWGSAEELKSTMKFIGDASTFETLSNTKQN
jgi:hypothetical protein